MEDVKMSVKVAINGFGRIGRLAFRQMFDAEGYEVVAINDLTSPKMLAHLLKYDTAQGSFCGKIGEGKHTVEATEDSIIVDGKEIKIYAEKDAANCPWGALNVDVVLECTGFYTSKEKSMAHINAGAKKVVISAPAGNDLKTIVYNVNQDTLTADDQIISAASCTTNCLAPMAKALNDYAPIQSGIMTTVHAYTGDQMILDGPHRKGDLRRSRAGAQNIVPNSTGAAKAIGLVIPELNGKLIGSAQRVPTPTGSTTILVAVVKGKDITKEGINAAMKAASSESFGYNTDEIVSSDVIGMRYGSLFDATQTMVAKIDEDTYQVQVVSWYDNENSYTSSDGSYHQVFRRAGVIAICADKQSIPGFLRVRGIFIHKKRSPFQRPFLCVIFHEWLLPAVPERPPGQNAGRPDSAAQIRVRLHRRNNPHCRTRKPYCAGRPLTLPLTWKARGNPATGDTFPADGGQRS